MYPKNDLYKIYKEHYSNTSYSRRFPDITKRFTLDNLNRAINCCEHWGSFLDVGAGSGHYSVPLLYKFKKGAAVEPGKNEHLDKLCDQYGNLTVKNDYIQNVSFSESFDFILLADLFEHIPQEMMGQFMDSLGGFQEKGGVVYLLTPNIFVCGPADESDIFHTKHANGHYKHYAKEEIIDIFSSRGYCLLFENYEEHYSQRVFKNIYWGLARRDKIFSGNIFYNLLSWPLAMAVRLFLRIMNGFVYRDELKKQNDSTGAVTIALIFKKIR